MGPRLPVAPPRRVVAELVLVGAAEPDRDGERAAEREVPHDREVERDPREGVDDAEVRLASQEGSGRDRCPAVGRLVGRPPSVLVMVWLE